MIYKTIFIILLSIVLQFIFNTINRPSYNKYFDNGKTVYDFLKHKNEQSLPPIDSEFLLQEYPKEHICETNYTWKHFDKEFKLSDFITFPPNTTPNMGYCLKIDKGTDEHDIKCTLENGGLKLLKVNETGNLGFFCYCEQPYKFINNYDDSNDCTLYAGCLNGIYNPETGHCDCMPHHNEYTNDELGIFNCRIQSKFKRGDLSNVIDNKFVDEKYLSLLEKNIQLPNPCTIDIKTGQLFKNAGQVTITSIKKPNGTIEEIAHCVVNDVRFVTINLNDDYLKNNGGKYANAIFQYTNKQEVNPNMYEVYFDYRKNELQNKSGYRLNYEDFLVKLPYLEEDSYNMFNIRGTKYDDFPVLPHVKYFDNRKVYVYNARTPTVEKIPCFTHIVFPAYFLKDPSMWRESRYYIGALGTFSGFGLWWEYYWNAQNSGTNHIDEMHLPAGDFGKADINDARVRKYRTRYPINGTGKNGTHVYNSLFSTGIYMNFQNNNIMYTKCISPHDIVLVNKFKEYLNPDWFKILANIHDVGEASMSKERQIVGTSKRFIWPENSFTFDTDEICTPSKIDSRVKETAEFELDIPEYTLDVN